MTREKRLPWTYQVIIYGVTLAFVIFLAMVSGHGVWWILGVAAVSFTLNRLYEWFKASPRYTTPNRKLMHSGLVIVFLFITVMEMVMGTGYWWLLSLALVGFSGWKIYTLSQTS